MGTAARPSRRCRKGAGARRSRWALRLAGLASGGVLVAAGAGHTTITGVSSEVDRVDPFQGLAHRPGATGGTNILVVGTDSRERLTATQRRAYQLGGTSCHCTDTIMLVHLSAARDRLSVISIPRDSYVELPPSVERAGDERRRPRPQKINAAYALGGPRLTVRGVEKLTGVHIDHYLEVDFTSFMRTVDVLGGVRVCTARPLRDAYSGLDLPAGAHTLNGGEALQYARSRSVDQAGDLGRMRRQRQLVAAIVDRAVSGDVLLNPVRFKEMASAVLSSVRADPNLDEGDLLRLGRAMHGLTPSSSEFTSVPIEDPGRLVPGVGSTVTWDRRKARALFAAVRADRPLAAHRSKGQRASDPALGSAATRSGPTGDRKRC